MVLTLIAIKAQVDHIITRKANVQEESHSSFHKVVDENSLSQCFKLKSHSQSLCQVNSPPVSYYLRVLSMWNMCSYSTTKISNDLFSC